MKGKTSLVLLEQVVMILVFALAAALCLQAFALSDRISAESELRGRAMLQVQNTAEIVKDCAGDRQCAAEKLQGAWDGESLVCASHDLTIRVVWQETDTEYLGAAEITAERMDGAVLAQVLTAWQEDGNG